MSKILLSTKEASEVLGVSTSTLYRLAVAGKLRRRKITSKRTAWLYSDLLSFAESL